MKRPPHYVSRPAAVSFRNEDGAFDLPSIITGVIVVGILIAGVLASIFGVIPFSQDAGAKQDLGSVTTAEGVSRSKLGGYDSASGLTSASLLPSGLDRFKIDAKKTNTNGWASAAKSGSGKIFLSTDGAPSPVDVTGTSSCIKPGTPLLSSPTITAQYQQTGSLAAGTFYWFVTAGTDPIMSTGVPTRMMPPATETLPSAGVGATLPVNSGERLVISVIPHAGSYVIYRGTTPNPSDALLLTTLGYPRSYFTSAGEVFDWTDTGSLTPATAPNDDVLPTVNNTSTSPFPVSCTPAPSLGVLTLQSIDTTTVGSPSPAPGTYTYAVTATSATGETPASYVYPDAMMQVANLPAGVTPRLTTVAKPGAASYKIYRTTVGTPGRPRLMATVVNPPTYLKSGSTVWDWVDHGTVDPGTDRVPRSDTTGVNPTTVTITDVASALATR